jgi:hypothetical protein
MAKAPTEIRSLAYNNQTVATVAQMRAHVVRLCEANGIEINYARHACADRGLREVWIRPVRSPHAYATALHEIGHILGRYQTASVSVLVAERWAWRWARRNALQWTPTMEQHAARGFKTYTDDQARHAKSYDDWKRRWKQRRGACPADRSAHIKSLARKTKRMDGFKSQESCWSVWPLSLNAASCSEV